MNNVLPTMTGIAQQVGYKNQREIQKVSGLCNASSLAAVDPGYGFKIGFIFFKFFSNMYRHTM